MAEAAFLIHSSSLSSCCRDYVSVTMLSVNIEWEEINREYLGTGPSPEVYNSHDFPQENCEPNDVLDYVLIEINEFKILSFQQSLYLWCEFKTCVTSLQPA